MGGSLRIRGPTLKRAVKGLIKWVLEPSETVRWKDQKGNKLVNGIPRVKKQEDEGNE